MLNFQKINVTEFLTAYWQKKPLLIRNALPDVKNVLSANELAGLALEEEFESRLVIQTPGALPEWRLKRGPFSENDFQKLPATHWTLLVQGVDRFIPQVTNLLDHFNFIPQWRVDDVMVSYAVEYGSVGPHYDNYDVFLYQAQGRRKWLLTTMDCTESNYRDGLDLRIMKEFKVEHEFILEQGDMLYLPPHVGHHGISESNDCMTYSFGYRNYLGQELWDSFGDYLSSKNTAAILYQDPSWNVLKNTSQIPPQAWIQAKAAMQAMLHDDLLVQDWFGNFATMLDQQAEALLPAADAPLEPEDITQFKQAVLHSHGLLRNPVCRFAYTTSEETGLITLHINGCTWCTEGVSDALIEKVANNRSLLLKDIVPFLDKAPDASFLQELCTLQWLEFLEKEDPA